LEGYSGNPNVRRASLLAEIERGRSPPKESYGIRTRNPLKQNGNLLKRINLCLTGKSVVFGSLPVQPPLQKYFCSRLTQISSLIRAVPSQERGVAHVTNVGRDAVDAAALGARRDGRAG
jgi:hypothetical protein